MLFRSIISGIKEKHPDKKIYVMSNENAQLVLAGNSNIESAFTPAQEFSSTEFLKENFYACYCLDGFSINNGHSILVA